NIFLGSHFGNLYINKINIFEKNYNMKSTGITREVDELGRIVNKEFNFNISKIENICNKPYKQVLVILNVTELKIYLVPP
ncbi:hypothetical protein, partial [Clostridium botulinum]